MSRILFLLLFFFSSGLCAQEPYALHLNKNKGLPSAVVYNVFQDSKGFIWMATNNGLTRYDGFEYLTYKSATQSSTPGSCIREDRYGRIWYENFDGFLHYVENDSLKGVKKATSYFYIPYGITAQHLITMQKKGIDIYDLKTLELKKTITIEGTKVEHANCDGENFTLPDSLTNVKSLGYYF
jgi:ligand-binding sensor domain-containing protein